MIHPIRQMLSKTTVLTLCLCLMPFAAMAQIQNDGTKTLGTIIQSQLDETDTPAGTNDIGPTVGAETTDDDNEAIPDDIIIDPDFLNDDVKAYDSYNKVVVRILDKVTAESRTFDLNIIALTQ